MVVGVVGAIVGGFLFGLFGISAAAGLLGSLITAVLGTVALLFVAGLVRKA
jgi:uncharacterized membrane protein YeaQ/YmgE (transglycosylase-associated protein family)